MILLTYGTRPEYIKIKPLIDEMIKQNIGFKTLFTGQHKDMVSDKATFNINMKMFGENRLDNIIQNCLNLPEEWFENITHILVQGDTTSVTGLSLAAMHRKIPIIHLEAGLRTYDNENPFPEENNRKIVSTIAKIHLCPTEYNKKCLESENTVGDIYVVGNTSLDNLTDVKSECEYLNKILITLHRRENHNKIDEWFTIINNLAKEYDNLEFILPIHPNPNVQKHKYILTNVKVVDPLSHFDLLNLLVKVKLVITDSGGLQEECSFLNKKCLVCREKTERPESLGVTSFLIKEPKLLKNYFDNLVNNFEVNEVSPYGDGKSAIKIVKILKKL
jgi:UDP-N-acetylglucosamine 2-epimerase (non-hydrolysing)